MQYLSEHPLSANCTVCEDACLACLHGLHAAVNAPRLSCQLSSCGVPKQQCGEETKRLLQGTCSKAKIMLIHRKRLSAPDSKSLAHEWCTFA